MKFGKTSNEAGQSNIFGAKKHPSFLEKNRPGALSLLQEYHTHFNLQRSDSRRATKWIVARTKITRNTSCNKNSNFLWPQVVRVYTQFYSPTMSNSERFKSNICPSYLRGRHRRKWCQQAPPPARWAGFCR